jgi:hypothetical protein
MGDERGIWRRLWRVPRKLPIFGGWRATVRCEWWTFVRRYDSELCQDCGRPYYATIWHADDELWRTLTRRANLLCPACFDHRAQRVGLFLIWRPTVEHDPARGAK